MRALCFSTLVLVSLGAVAQTPSGDGPVDRYQQRTVIDISEATIEGVVVGPSTTAVRAGKRPAFKHLIRLRPDFRKELSATTDALSASR